MAKLSKYSHPHKPMVCIGYVPVNENDEVHRPIVNGNYGSKVKATMKMYPTKKRAAAYSPVKKSVPVWAYSGE